MNHGGDNAAATSAVEHWSTKLPAAAVLSVYAGVQHIQVQNSNFETCGRVMLGMEPSTPLL